MSPAAAPAYGSFEFPFGAKLIESTKEYLSELGWAPLSMENVNAQLGTSQKTLGVYLLGIKDPSAGQMRITYVGQSEKAIYVRLMKHAKYIRDRIGLNPDDVVFKAAEIVMLSSMRIEAQLIKDYGTKWNKKKQDCGWNGSGFGSNDTGGNRDAQKPSQFDIRYPVDITLPKQDALPVGPTTPKLAIEHLSGKVPYTVRVAPKDSSHSDLSSHVTFGNEDSNCTAEEAARRILNALPSWCAKVHLNKIVFERGAQTAAPLFDATTWPPDNGFAYII